MTETSTAPVDGVHDKDSEDFIPLPSLAMRLAAQIMASGGRASYHSLVTTTAYLRRMNLDGKVHVKPVDRTMRTALKKLVTLGLVERRQDNRYWAKDEGELAAWLADEYEDRGL